MTLLASVSPAIPYVVGLVITIILFFTSVVISQGIKFKPDLSDVKKRKVCFWTFAVLIFLLTLGVGFGLYLGVKGDSAQRTFLIHLLVASFLSPGLYILAGWIVAKIYRNGKLGNWF